MICKRNLNQWRRYSKLRYRLLAIQIACEIGATLRVIVVMPWLTCDSVRSNVKAGQCNCNVVEMWSGSVWVLIRCVARLSNSMHLISNSATLMCQGDWVSLESHQAEECVVYLCMNRMCVLICTFNILLFL